jgi:hypothetical protein
MQKREFSEWVKFSKRSELEKYKWGFPGIYAIVYSEKDISKKTFDLLENIVYFGMTNAKNGIKGRLQQFDNTINTKNSQHGGAERFIFSLSKEDKLWKNKLYVSIMVFNCDVNSNLPKDLLIMGDVCKQEYICFSEYVSKFGKFPRFNDKKASTKKEKK